MPDPGHVDSWAAPATGWPTFCQHCGCRLAGEVCRRCDSLLSQHEETSDPDLRP